MNYSFVLSNEEESNEPLVTFSEGIKEERTYSLHYLIPNPYFEEVDEPVLLGAIVNCAVVHHLAEDDAPEGA